MSVVVRVCALFCASGVTRRLAASNATDTPRAGVSPILICPVTLAVPDIAGERLCPLMTDAVNNKKIATQMNLKRMTICLLLS
jgi:hypothetical protein